MKILVGIPCLYNADATKEAIDSIIDKAKVVLVDNNAEQPVKDVIYSYPYAVVLTNRENIFVNPAWNQIMKFFLLTDYTHLIIMNSDLVMQPGWYENLRSFLTNHPDMIPIPVINGEPGEGFTIVHEGTPGVFICLNRKQVGKVYPIPDYIKIWFGDNWIYEILRVKYKTVILNNLVAKHYHSQSVSRLPGISEMIEEDKLQWAEHSVEDKMAKIRSR